jgi:hypothetical protein
MPKTQGRLEVAAKAVIEACKALVRLVRTISAKQVEEEDVDYKNMAALEFKKREMEQQVEILRLEKGLGAARHRLGQMRRAGYHTRQTNKLGLYYDGSKCEATHVGLIVTKESTKGC